MENLLIEVGFFIMSKIFNNYTKTMIIGFLAGMISRFFLNRRRTYISSWIYISIKARATNSKRNIGIKHITDGNSK